ncbi:MAG: FAD-binding oxidoreductase [Celeribacter sp.]
MTHVTVHGAGILGLACSFALLERGVRVTLRDLHGVGAGASGGIVGALAPHTPENWNPKKAFQLDSLLAAEPFWRRVQRIGGRDPGYARSGRVQPVADAHALDLARARTATAAELWGDHAAWRVIRSVDAPLPAEWRPDSATGWLIHDTLSGRLHPAQACAALAAAIITLGGQILTGTDQDAPVPPGPQLWATGWEGLATLSEGRTRPVGAPIKGQAALLAPAMRLPIDLPQLFIAGLHVIPHRDGTVAIGSTTEREFDNGHVTDAALDPLIDAARAACPALRDAAVIGCWAGLRPRARSRAPMLGGWPDRPGHFIANGGFKIGFGMAPGIAACMADLILDGHDRIPDGFRVEDSF